MVAHRIWDVSIININIESTGKECRIKEKETPTKKEKRVFSLIVCVIFSNSAQPFFSVFNLNCIRHVQYVVM